MIGSTTSSGSSPSFFLIISSSTIFLISCSSSIFSISPLLFLPLSTIFPSLSSLRIKSTIFCCCCSITWSVSGLPNSISSFRRTAPPADIFSIILDLTSSLAFLRAMAKSAVFISPKIMRIMGLSIVAICSKKKVKPLIFLATLGFFFSSAFKILSLKSLSNLSNISTNSSAPPLSRLIFSLIFLSILLTSLPSICLTVVRFKATCNWSSGDSEENTFAAWSGVK
ncbi:hypothetical protein ES705_02447 [subsurface metagenome]